MQTNVTGAEILAISGNDATYQSTSGVSWGAVVGGAVAAAALSLILLMLGVGLGLSSVSPWSYNISAMGTSTIAWLAFMQLAASGIGGYIAGRLRIKWSDIHTNEVYFRDTAHGFLAWALASLLSVAVLTSAIHTILSGASEVGANTIHAAASAATNAKGNPVDYFSDLLLRSDQVMPDGSNNTSHSEVSKILLTDMVAGKLTAEDREYLSKTIVKRTGMSQSDAEKRVDSIFAQFSKSVADAENSAKEAADRARKAAAHSALWMFVALLLGAFVASLSATLGGRQRDSAHLLD